MQHSSTRRKGNHKYANMQICTPLMTWAHLIGAWRIRGELSGTTPPSGQTGWNIQKGFARTVQKTKVEQSTSQKKEEKISLKKSEVNWIFTLYSRAKMTNNKKTLNSLLVLCPQTELQYDCELAEKRAWLFHSDEHLEQYKRLITCVNAVWHFMSLLCWPYARVDGREPSSKEVRLVSKCGNIKNSVRRKRTNENKKWWNQRKESNDNVVPVPKWCVIFLDSSCSISEVRQKWAEAASTSFTIQMATVLGSGLSL